MAQVKLHVIPNVQFLSYQGKNILEVENNPLNRFDTLFFKGEDNTLDFAIVDKDRRAITLLDKTLTIYISNVETEELKIKRDLDKLDEENGLARLTLSNGDTVDLVPGFYKYAVVVVEDNGRSGFAFVDQVFRATGTFELRDGAIPFPNDSQTITTFVDQSFFFDDDTFISSAVTANNGSNHTAIWDLTNYIGVIKIQGTLDNTIPTNNDSNWTDILTQSFTSTAGNGLQFFNWSGNYTFFRFVHEPNVFSEGTVDEVVYR